MRWFYAARSVLRISQLDTAFGLSGGRSGATFSSIRRLRTPTRGICRRVTGVFRAPTRGFSAGGFPRASFYTSTSLTTTSGSPLTSSASSSLNVTHFSNPKPGHTTGGSRRSARLHAVKRKRNRTNPYFPEMGPISSVLNAVLRRIGFSAPRCSFFRSRRQILSRIRRGREFLLHRGAIAQLVPAIGANSSSKFGALIRTQFRSEL